MCFINISLCYITFIKELNLKFIFNKRLKVSYVRNSGQTRLVSYKYKENKRNCIFLDIGFVTENAKLKYP